MNEFETFGRPLPDPDLLTEAFWAAARENRLLVQRCNGCGKYEWTPQFACSACLADTLDWTDVSGRGSVYASTVVRVQQVAGMVPPYVIAIVVLDEGVHMLTNIVGVEPEAVRIGQRVEVSFVRASDDIALPCFRPLSDADGSWTEPGAGIEKTARKGE